MEGKIHRSFSVRRFGSGISLLFHYGESVREGKDDGRQTEEKGSITFNDVSFRYPGAAENCLEHISFQVNQGETLAIIGATGSGKSTLAGLAARLYDASEGEVLIDGKNVKDYSFRGLYDKMGDGFPLLIQACYPPPTETGVIFHLI